MKVQLLNFWHKIKDWLLVLPALLMFEEIAEMRFLPEHWLEGHRLFELFGALCFNNLIIMQWLTLLLLLLSFSSLLTSQWLIVRFFSFPCTLYWLLSCFYVFMGPND
jgi:hypothetical protein